VIGIYVSEIVIPPLAPIILMVAFVWLLTVITIFGKDWRFL